MLRKIIILVLTTLLIISVKCYANDLENMYIDICIF